jgi:hypothetical protein
MPGFRQVVKRYDKTPLTCHLIHSSPSIPGAAWMRFLAELPGGRVAEPLNIDVDAASTLYDANVGRSRAIPLRWTYPSAQPTESR